MAYEYYEYLRIERTATDLSDSEKRAHYDRF